MTSEIRYNQTEFGKRIKKARIQSKITQSELAEEMNISVNMLSRIETGKNSCAPEYLAFFCFRLHKSADYFYFGKDDTEEKSTEEILKELGMMIPELSQVQIKQVYKIVKIVTEAA